MPQKQHKRKPATVNDLDYSFFVLILILLFRYRVSSSTEFSRAKKSNKIMDK